MTSAVVFAYHNVGVRCLSVLLAHGIDVKLVVTHQDNPGENIWFASVSDLARVHGLKIATPADPNSAQFIASLQVLAPDFIFSFYYRHMLKPAVLATAKRGAFNMHGSLLPKYRGRVPVNWAIIKGERETGATLHEMVEKPDAGRIVDRMAVPILPNDLAIDVFGKVTLAAEIVLDRSLPKLLDGSARLTVQDLSGGSYFGGRKPGDGLIDWHDSAQHIHNLVRGVAPPYPGATTTLNGATLAIHRALMAGRGDAAPGTLQFKNDCCYATCGDGRELRIIELAIDGLPVSGGDLLARYGAVLPRMGK
jgi:methionyl-tRNA formyltransferase